MVWIGKAMKYANKTAFMKRRRRRFRKDFPNINSAVKPIYGIAGMGRTVNFLKGVINSELKRYDENVNSLIDSSGVITALSDMGTGDTINVRDGWSILAKYDTAKFTFVMNASATTTLVRLILFVDTQNNGVLPTVADVLGSADVSSLINPKNTQRFTVLYDRRYSMSINANRSIIAKAYKKLDFHIRYTADASGVASQSKNGIFLLAISSEATNTPTLDFHNRIAYYDN